MERRKAQRKRNRGSQFKKKKQASALATYHFELTGESIGRGRVLDPPSSLKQQGTEPTILSLIELHVVACLLRLGRIHLHHVVVHEGLGAEEGEAAGGTEDAAEHVLSGLLQPTTDGVLEHLVPLHESRS